MAFATEVVLKYDRVAFARTAGFDPEPWQERVLCSESPRILLNCSRQSGKSSTVSLIACHTALYVPNSTTLIVSYALRQSVELFRKVVSRGTVVQYMPTMVVGSTQTSFEFDNGSRVVALPGSEASIRSFSNVHTLLFDEASHVPNETYEAARPVVAAVGGGRIIALSTPWGKRGWWWEAWRDTSPDAEPWERYKVPATECPHILPSFLAQERRRMGSFWYDQEYGTEFLDADSSALRSEDVDRAIQDYEVWDFAQFLPHHMTPTTPKPLQDAQEQEKGGDGLWNFQRPAPAPR
jgi:hypothetical protein